MKNKSDFVFCKQTTVTGKEAFRFAVNRERKHAVGCVERLLDAVAVMNVNVDVEHTRKSLAQFDDCQHNVVHIAISIFERNRIDECDYTISCSGVFLTCSLRFRVMPTAVPIDCNVTLVICVNTGFVTQRICKN
jgi:hypothetical protein